MTVIMASSSTSGQSSGIREARPVEPVPDPGRGNPHLPQPKARLTPEEIRVLQECTAESFWYRCIPLAAVFGGATAYFVKTGHLKAHPRFGPLPKTAGAVFLAYILGKVSYQNACQQKILERIPSSNLAQSVRKSRGTETVYTSELSSDAGPEMGFTQQSKLRDEYSSFDSSSSSDSSYRVIRELDDNKRPTLDREVKIQDEAVSGPQQTLTYDELRQRNRQEYERTLATSPGSPFRQRPFPGPHIPKSSQPPQEKMPNTSPGQKKNEYGDVME